MQFGGCRESPRESGRPGPQGHFRGSLESWAVVGPPLSSAGCRSCLGFGAGVRYQPVLLTSHYSTPVSVIPKGRLGLSLGERSRLVFCKGHLFSPTPATSRGCAGNTGEEGGP